jgi:outer membrane receptor protein involved in Fe transport
MAGYLFGPVRNQESVFQLSVNVENLTDRRYFQSGNTPSSFRDIPWGAHQCGEPA